MPERLSGVADETAPTGPPAPAPRQVVLGLLVVVFGGLVLSHSVLGLPFLAAGAWLASGRGLAELRHGIAENRRYLLRWAVALLFFAAALRQAWFALLPTLPLFAISFVIAPPRREARDAATGWSLHPLLRECVVVALLCVYGYLVAYDLAARAEDTRQRLVRHYVEGR